MWKSSRVLTLLLLFMLLSSIVIDEVFGASKIGGRVTKRITTTDLPKVQNLNSLCHILNYAQLNNPGIKTYKINLVTDPIKVYQTGYRNRVEYVRAVITPQTITSKGSATIYKTRKFARDMGKLKDDAGHIIGNQLGGTGKEVYNIFPQSPNINRGAWSKEENEIKKLVTKTKQPIEVIVQLFYSTATATRPDHFMYRSAYSNACHSATVRNP